MPETLTITGRITHLHRDNTHKTIHLTLDDITRAQLGFWLAVGQRLALIGEQDDYFLYFTQPFKETR